MNVRRIIRYFKRWKNKKFSSSGNVEPPSIGITLIAVDKFEVSKKYDYLEEKYILVGNRTYENDLKEKGLITIVDKNGNKLVDEINDKYISYQAVEIVKNRIIILANNEEKKSFILTYNFDGTLLSEVEIKNDLNNQYITDMYKLANKLVFTIPYQEGDIKEESYLILYNYNLSINKENSAYGTINIDENALPYTKVFFDILPNSGYEIDNISIKDYQGKIIETSENSFIMPENDIILCFMPE